MTSKGLASVLLPAALGFAALPAAALEVTAVTVQISPAASKGPCPVTFTFSGKVALSKQGRFTYKWERSDGAIDTVAHPPVAYDGVHAALVSETWTLGAATPAFHPFNGWVKLHVLSPEDKVSGPAHVKLDCGPPPPTLAPGAIARPTVPGGFVPPPK